MNNPFSCKIWFIVIQVLALCIYALLRVLRLEPSFTLFTGESFTSNKLGYITHLGPSLRQRRLGNQMFEYAALMITANMTSRYPLLGSNFDVMKQTFQLTYPRMNAVSYRWKFGGTASTLFDATNASTEKWDEFSNHSGNLRMVGWTHDYHYFENAADEIRKEFTFTKTRRRAVKAFFHKNKLLGNGMVKVGVHLRRGDALEKYWIKRGYLTPPLSYFKNAMTYFTSRFHGVHFVICSNGLKWAKEHLAGDNVVFSQHSDPGLDMAILSLCDHIIIGQGTYGWWAGWLNRGITVRYSKVPRIELRYTPSQYWPANNTYNHYVVIDS